MSPAGPAVLRVYDVLGGLVREVRAAEGSVVLTGLQPGTYVARVEAGGSVEEARFVATR